MIVVPWGMDQTNSSKIIPNMQQDNRQVNTIQREKLKGLAMRLKPSSLVFSAYGILRFMIRSAALGRWPGLTVAGIIGLLTAMTLYSWWNTFCIVAIQSDLDMRGRDSARGIMRTSPDHSTPPTPAEFNYAPQEDSKGKRLFVEKWPAADSLSAGWDYSTASTDTLDAPLEALAVRRVNPMVRASYSIRLNNPTFTPQAQAPSNPPTLPTAAAHASPPPSPPVAASEPPVSKDPYESSYLLCVEVVEFRTDSELLLCIEVAYQHRGEPDEKNSHGRVSMRRIEWWKGLAESNAILRLQRRPGPIPVVSTSFPTTINAFCTYLEERFLNEAKMLNSDYARSVWLNRVDAKRFATGGVAPLKAMLSHDFGPTLQSTPVLLLLLYSQYIQFTCLFLWLTFLVCLLCRNILFVRIEQCAIWSERAFRHSSILSRCREARQRSETVEDSLNHGWRVVLEHSSYLDQLLACVSLTGYVGTLYFLAISFPEASNLISSSRVEMISSLSRFTLLMAGAFTTSLWSSCWFQIGSWLKTVQLTAELRQIDSERHALI